jgi:hypothetical protein
VGTVTRDMAHISSRLVPTVTRDMTNNSKFYSMIHRFETSDLYTLEAGTYLVVQRIYLYVYNCQQSLSLPRFGPAHLTHRLDDLALLSRYGLNSEPEEIMGCNSTPPRCVAPIETSEMAEGRLD